MDREVDLTVIPPHSPGNQSVSQNLVRGLSLFDATMLVVGSMIGSGIFLVSAESSRLTGAPGWLLLAWLLAGILTLTGALSCAELAAAYPRAGGQYVFLREAYGALTGFLFGWALFIVIQTGTIAAVAVAFANFSGVLFPSVAPDKYLVAPIHLGAGYAVSLSTQQLVAVGMILLLTFVNMQGLQFGRVIQNLFTFTKTAALVGLILIGLLLGWNAGGAAFSSAWWDSAANGWTPAAAQSGLTVGGTLAIVLLLGRAMVGPLFAQSAWNNVTFAGGEVRDAARNLPRALLYGCALVVVLYLLANVAYIVTLSLAEIQTASGNRVATALMQKSLGNSGTTMMAALIMVSTFGCNNGLILAGARVSYAMARDGLFLRRAGQLNKAQVPAAALLMQGVWAAFLTLPRTVSYETGAAKYGNVYTQLLEYIVSADLVFYALMVGAVIVLRRRLRARNATHEAANVRPAEDLATQPSQTDAAPLYRTFGYPVTPLMYILLATLLILDLAYLTPRTSLIGYLLVALGIPLFRLRRQPAKTAETP